MKTKLISEKAWKDILTKHDFEDKGLLKALGHYHKLAETKHAERIKALGAIGQLANNLKKEKAIAAISQVAKALTEIFAASATDRKDIEAQANAAGMAESEIEDGEHDLDIILLELQGYVRDCWDAYARGINSFGKAMSAAALRNATGSDLGTVEQLFVHTLEQVPGVSAVTGGAKILADAFSTEPLGAGGMSAEDYIYAIEGKIDSGKAKMLQRFKPGGALTKLFRDTASRDADAGKTLLAQVKSFSQTAEKHFKRYNAVFFENKFATAFADTGGKTLDVKSNILGQISDIVVRDAGVLRFQIYVRMETDGTKRTWKITKSSPRWKLTTTAPDPQGIAKSLQRSGAGPWKLGFPRYVYMEVSSFEPGSDWPTSVDEGTLIFNKDNAGTKPNSFGPGVTNQQLLLEAWDRSTVRGEAIGNTDLEGSNK